MSAPCRFNTASRSGTPTAESVRYMSESIPADGQADEDIRTSMSAGALRKAVDDHLRYSIGRPAALLTPEHYYRALALAVRDRMQEQLDRRPRRPALDLGRKVTCYLSAEFLMGPQLGSNLLNLGIEDAARAALAALGQDLDDVLACEEEPGLGNGGLGRLAACYLDSLATLERPAIGYGIRYEFGIFDQEIHDGWQVEKTDNWLADGNPWEIAKPDAELPGQLGRPHRALRRRRRPRPGALGARAGRQGRLLRHPDPGLRREHLQHADAVERAAPSSRSRWTRSTPATTTRPSRTRSVSETVTKVLYPNDEPEVGQAASSAAAVLLRVVLAAGHAAHHGRSGRLPRSASCPTEFAIQLNDTHPSIARRRADAAARRRTQTRLGRGLGDHRGDVRLHQPHAAARGAGDVAAGDVRRVPAAPPRDHLRDQPPLPRRGARDGSPATRTGCGGCR